jgi:hypothetical protein
MKGITSQQRIYLMSTLWRNAARFQGWAESDEARRYWVYAQVLGHWPDHAKTLAKGKTIRTRDFVKSADRDDFGAVKRELLDLAGLKAKPGDDPVKRTKVWVIQQRLMPCYLLYRPGTALATILHDRFKRYAGLNSVEDLSPADLDNVIMTLEARVNVVRNEAGDSHHAMCARAGVQRWKPCGKDCPECRGAEHAAEIEPEPEYAGASEGQPF